MMSNPNMSLMEFAQKVGGITLQPHQIRAIRMIEAATERGQTLTITCHPPRHQRAYPFTVYDEAGEVPEEIWEASQQQPRFRTLSGGKVKDTKTGYVVDDGNDYKSLDDFPG